MSVGYTKNGILKAMLQYHKHLDTKIEDQLEVNKAHTAANAALENRNAASMQQVQQCWTRNEPRC